MPTPVRLFVNSVFIPPLLSSIRVVQPCLPCVCSDFARPSILCRYVSSSSNMAAPSVTSFDQSLFSHASSKRCVFRDAATHVWEELKKRPNREFVVSFSTSVTHFLKRVITLVVSSCCCLSFDVRGSETGSACNSSPRATVLLAMPVGPQEIIAPPLLAEILSSADGGRPTPRTSQRFRVAGCICHQLCVFVLPRLRRFGPPTRRRVSPQGLLGYLGVSPLMLLVTVAL